ncbi:ATP-dependent DNA helicase RecG [Oscillospiraceae bacterium LTW-04]|nr:ATP-dependent DNA helicase RecG [Oscillospiraceae bacterium MB24-C1]
MGLTLNDSVTKINGVGPKKALLYHRLGIDSVRRLLLHLPRSYVDLTRISTIAQCGFGNPYVIRAEVLKKSREQRIRKGLSIFKVEVGDGEETLLLTFFNTRFVVDSLKVGQSYLFYGIMGGTLIKREISAPQILSDRWLGRLMPVYPVCAGLSSRAVAQDVQRALAALSEPVTDTLPQDVRENAGLPTLDEAVRIVHAPESLPQCEAARGRILFEELLVFSAAMLRLRSSRCDQKTAPMVSGEMRRFFDSLPFTPTGGQFAAIEDIDRDLSSGNVMNRLIQGDVGSGKTLVAAAAAYIVWQNGKQTALMAPTELLAEQHYKTLTQLLTPFGIRVALMTGSLKAKERRVQDAWVASGERDVIVGTHALLSGSTEFASLGLVITDEQHRFGVAQRAALTAKGNAVHTLVMSATPIPRTLSLILYGDLDVSLIKELPPGRTPVATYRIDSAKRLRAFSFICERLNEGRQAYIVCPLVSAQDEETQQTQPGPPLHAAEDYAKTLAVGVFKAYTVGLLHGKMKPADKERVMARFAAGEIQLLVSTTVIEVGVDVPNAAVMLIENAERFGLSQLHQLRGRVGRGKHSAYCILVTDSKSQATAERLAAIAATNDGFRIAEEDLRLRGPGDILGARQHGLPGLENADLAQDAALFLKAQQVAATLLREDPDLSRPDHGGIAQGVNRLIAQVGERPN